MSENSVFYLQLVATSIRYFLTISILVTDAVEIDCIESRIVIDAAVEE